MPSLKIVRKVFNYVNGSNSEQTILEIVHKQRATVHRIYNLLLENDALEGGDVITYEERKKIQKYHLCMGCHRRAIESSTETKCSSCKKSKVKEALPLDQAALINATPNLQAKRDSLKASKSKLESDVPKVYYFNGKITSLDAKPKPDYSKYYKHSVNGSFDDTPYETQMRRD
jgi:hypothetical protein